MRAGERLVVVADDEALRERLSQLMWEQGGKSFLANGTADGPHASRQPILVSAQCSAPNEARLVILADGRWREEAGTFDRAMLLFDPAAADGARDLWRDFAAREDIDNRIFKQTQEGAWLEGR